MRSAVSAVLFGVMLIAGEYGFGQGRLACESGVGDSVTSVRR